MDVIFLSSLQSDQFEPFSPFKATTLLHWQIIELNGTKSPPDSRWIEPKQEDNVDCSENLHFQSFLESNNCRFVLHHFEQTSRLVLTVVVEIGNPNFYVIPQLNNGTWIQHFRPLTLISNVLFPETPVVKKFTTLPWGVHSAMQLAFEFWQRLTRWNHSYPLKRYITGESFFGAEQRFVIFSLKPTDFPRTPMLIHE